ncbi:GTPase Der [bacterium HR18]|uniref:GTPase Der n=1 Tax=Rhodothermus marinus TaxID=29549 RepID=A0A7V2B1T2_RHOMR|nr:GTPase Der [bacterium HR18]
MALVAIVGRPNVGKSTLFNRLTRSQQAITHDEPGVTRDRIYGTAEWNGVSFSVVDTGGYVPHSADIFEQAIREQVEIAIQEADLILFMVDASTGITDLDDALAQMLRRTEKPVIVVANKADNDERTWEAQVFYQLGLPSVYPISALSGRGTGELLDALVQQLPRQTRAPISEERPRLAIVGRPNVGKSSLTNALLGEERAIVTDKSGATRDAVHSVLKYYGREIVLVDTAGLRRRSRIRENIEFYATLRTERALRECDVALVLLEATEGVTAQDIRILRQAEALRKGMVLVVNKWDLVEKDANTMRLWEEAIRARLPTWQHVPLLFISAKTRQRIHRVLETALMVYENRRQRVPTSRLNEVLQAALAQQHPPSYRTHPVKIKYAVQLETAPPVFAFFCNRPEAIKESYRRYLEKQLRAAFGFEGVPLTLVFKQK